MVWIMDVIKMKIDNEVVVALIGHGYHEWDNFMHMKPTDVDSLKKADGKGSMVPCMLAHRRTIERFLLFVDDRKTRRDDNWDIAATYTKECFRAFFSGITIHTPGSIPPLANNTSADDRALEGWIRGKRLKTDFRILKVDKHHRAWKGKFEAEVEYQGFKNIIDPKFNPGNLKGKARELFKLQQTYAWTVFIEVFQNPLGVTSLSPFQSTKDAPSAYLNHERLQLASPADNFDLNKTINDLSSMRCVEFNGTNLEFVVEFFETLTTLNNTSANKSNPIIGYHVGSALFLGTLKGAKDLVRYSNAQPAPTGNDAVDIITMKDYYLHAAGLCDGNDESDKMSNPKSRINALVHEFGIKAEDTATATALIRAFAANRAYRGPDPATRISDAIFHSLPREDQKKWATMAPQSKKLLFDDIKGDRERPSGRPSERKQRVMFTDSEDVSDDDVFEDVAQYEVFDDDSPNSLLAKVHDLLVNVTKGKNQNVKKSKPLKSDLHAAHPARLLSDAKEVVYKKNGNTFVAVGTMNARMHRWMTVEEVSETDTTTIGGVTYNVSASKLMQLLCQALIDRGANGCVFGSDCTLIGEPTTQRFVAITGLDNHRMANIPIRNVGSLCMSTCGPVICIWNEVAYTGQNQSIVSATQLEAYHNRVEDSSLLVGGGQRITNVDGYVFNLSIKQGLPYLKMRAYTTKEYNEFPHVIMTSDQVWDPSIFDNEIEPNDPSFVEKASKTTDGIATDQEDGEKVTGRPPDVPYDTADSDDSSDASEHGETEAPPVHVILTDEKGEPKLDSEGNPMTIPGIAPSELQGRTFLQNESDGSIRRGRIVEQLGEQASHFATHPDIIKFKVKYDKDDLEDILTYNDIMNFIQRETTEEDGQLWKFRRIVGHQGPLTHRDKGQYKQCKYNVCIEWENGERSYEPLKSIKASDPITLALYAKENNLLDTDGWKELRPYAKRTKKMIRTINQIKLRSFRTAPRYQYGFQVPQNYEEACRFDERNGNDKWTEATKLEMGQMKEYDVFIDKGEFNPGKIPKDFKKIKVHLIFAIKHDGRHKARLVADGHLTDVPLNSVYSGVVSLRGLRMCIFLAELNGMEAYATDIGNAYLEAKTGEKVCIKAGPEFGPLQGHLLIIFKALYGLRSSGLAFGQLLAACLKKEGFVPSKCEPEIFMRRNGDLWEYVATYVDDLCIVMKDPEAFLKVLTSKPYSFKLKGSGALSFHLGCGFHRDIKGVLCMDPLKYIEKMEASYKQLFGCLPDTKHLSPLEKGDQPRHFWTKKIA